MVAPTRPLAVSIADAADPQSWLAKLSTRFSTQQIADISLAMNWAYDLYRGKTLADTGEPTFPHAVATASIVADLNLSTEPVIAALLFAAPDHLPDAVEQIGARFGAQAAKLVDGICKVRKIAALAKLDHSRPADLPGQTEALRKMLLAMVEDIRVVLIKLAWRTQTMHYLSQCDDHTRRRIARETLDIFAPLANRLGVWQIKWELEDLGFRFLEPQLYKKVAKLLDERRVDRERFIADVIAQLRRELSQAGIKAELMGRPKHIYSIYKKMQKKRLDFSELYDIRAVRILVPDIKDCYTALGIVHNLWQPIPGEFDDYIAQPKGNFYRSLHTAVIGPEDKGVEVQIRTFDMHEHAEYGVAAHWRYKEGGQGDSHYEEKIAWLRQLLDWREDVADQADMADAFKSQLFHDSIYVLSPQGKVVALPKGSTPVDFAYHVHTDLGHRCRGAKVNGHIVPLNTALENGQRVEILAGKELAPSLDWLHQGYLKSPRAMAKVRQWIKQQNLDVAIDAGREMFERELGRHQHKIELVAERLGFTRPDELFAALGHGEVSARQLHLAVEEPKTEVANNNTLAEEIIRESRADTHGEGILIEGVDKLMTMLAKCCKPVPPDAVIGFVTKGRGISIHRSNCPTLKRLSASAPERLISAAWGKQQGQVFATEIEVEAHDRPSLLKDLFEVVAREKINITAVNTLSRDNRAQMRLTLEIRDSETLNRLIHRLHEVGGVIDIHRR